MKKSRFPESQIVSILKEADAGVKVNEFCGKLGANTECQNTRASGCTDNCAPIAHL